MTLELTSLAGARQLSANAYLLRVDGVEILLDAGAAAPRDDEWVRRLPRRPDAVWISHAHADHIGALAKLLERFPSIEPWCTHQTRAIARHALVGHLGEARARALAQKLRAVHPRAPFTLAPGVSATAFPAGHVLGAACLLLDTSVDAKFHKILYTGDFCAHEQPLTPGCQLPVFSEERPLDLLVMEGVLGTDRRADEVDYDVELARLCSFVEEGEGPVLLALASLGEACEVAASLLEQTRRHLTVHESMSPIFDEYARGVGQPELWGRVEFSSTAACAALLRAGGTVLAPGEHLSGKTPARQLVTPLIRDATARICVLNSLRHKSLAAKLLAKRGKAIDYDGVSGVVRADIARFLLPNHAPRWALLGVVKALKPRHIALVHGKAKGLEHLSHAVRKLRVAERVVVPELGESLTFDVG